MFEGPRKATCHPSRPYLAKGLCESCYYKARRKAERAAARLLPKPVEQKRAVKPEKPVTVVLQLRHSVNGKFYGPGRVTLSRAKAETFLNTEHEAAMKEQSLQQQQAYIIENRSGVIGKRQVPWAQFDDFLARSEVKF